MTEPTRDQAAELLRTAGRLGHAVGAADRWRYVAWLPGARSMAAGFPRRLARALVVWGALFGLVLAAGLVLPAPLVLWVAGGVAAAVPLALAVRAEVRA